MHILLLDLGQMLGHILKPCLEDFGYQVTTISENPTSPVYYNPEQDVYAIENIIQSTQPDVVVNCIASWIQASEDHHARAALLNSFLPHFLDDLSQKHHFKLIHRSTDCVFEGTIGNYTEASVPDATSFYGKTKALGEVNNDHSLTLRVSIIGPDPNPAGDSLFPWFLRQSGTVTGYSRVFWTGVTTMEFARILDLSIKNHLTGLYNVSNGEKIAKSDLLRLFAKYYPLDHLTINDNDDKKSDKSLIPSYDFKIPNYDIMINNMRKWTDAHAELYPHLQERSL